MKKTVGVLFVVLFVVSAQQPDIEKTWWWNSLKSPRPWAPRTTVSGYTPRINDTWWWNSLGKNRSLWKTDETSPPTEDLEEFEESTGVYPKRYLNKLF